MAAYNHKWGQAENNKIETTELFFRIKNVFERKSMIHWHINYLEKYKKENIRPFGLIIQIFPNFQNPSPDFRKTWEDSLTKSSIKLMEILIDEHKKKLKN